MLLRRAWNEAKTKEVSGCELPSTAVAAAGPPSELREQLG